jgi:hypothetical protein
MMIGMPVEDEEDDVELLFKLILMSIQRIIIHHAPCGFDAS